MRLSSCCKRPRCGRTFATTTPNSKCSTLEKPDCSHRTGQNRITCVDSSRFFQSLAQSTIFHPICSTSFDYILIASIKCVRNVIKLQQYQIHVGEKKTKCTKCKVVGTSSHLSKSKTIEGVSQHIASAPDCTCKHLKRPTCNPQYLGQYFLLLRFILLLVRNVWRQSHGSATED